MSLSLFFNIIKGLPQINDDDLRFKAGLDSWPKAPLRLSYTRQFGRSYSKSKKKLLASGRPLTCAMRKIISFRQNPEYRRKVGLMYQSIMSEC